MTVNPFLLYIFLGVYPIPLTFLAARPCVRDTETPPVKGTQKAKTPYTIFALHVSRGNVGFFDRFACFNQYPLVPHPTSKEFLYTS